MRIEFEVLASGQPRPYADSVFHARVTFTNKTSYGPNAGEYVPSLFFDNSDQEDKLRQLLRAVPFGFTDSPPENWASTRLDWLRNDAPGVWEYHTTSPFTD